MNKIFTVIGEGIAVAFMLFVLWVVLQIDAMQFNQSLIKLWGG
jgi:hypothetical protein